VTILFLFILESIGTPELILIAIVALIVLGPRKLPQMAKSIGKTMAEFRNATNEFKTTWEREVAFEDEKTPDIEPYSPKEIAENNKNSDSGDFVNNLDKNELPEPEVRELTSEDIAQNFQIKAEKDLEKQESKLETKQSQKTDWL
jgi:sec-independent protein translocase protein TatA